MPDAISQYLCPSFAATFASDYPLAESVERFEQALAGYTLLDRATRKALVGDVYGRGVEVRQSGWGDRAYYSMVFTGEFRQTEAGVVLAGHFALRANEWVLPGLLVGGLIGCTVVFAVGAALHHGRDWWWPLLPIGMIVLTVVNIVQGQHMRSNRQWLSRTIARILSRSKDAATRSSEPVPAR